jgi:hypothetical protein
MTPKPTCVDGRADLLLTAPHDLGMSASRAAAPLVRDGCAARDFNTTQALRNHAGARPGKLIVTHPDVRSPGAATSRPAARYDLGTGHYSLS